MQKWDRLAAQIFNQFVKVYDAWNTLIKDFITVNSAYATTKPDTPTKKRRQDQPLRNSGPENS